MKATMAFVLILLLFSVSCFAPTPASKKDTSTDEKATYSPVELPTTVATEEIPPTVARQTLFPQLTPTPGAMQQASSVRCESIESEILYDGIDGNELLPRNYHITSLDFLSENELLVRGWSAGDKFSQFSEVAFDLEASDFRILPPKPTPPLSTLCIECTPYVFTTSPNGNYQLARYLSNGGLVWIAGPESAVRVSDNTSYVFNWQWADDESWAWIAWSSMEYGYEVALIRTHPEISIETLAIDSPLHTTGHRVAFDPSASEALSAGSDIGFIPNGKLELYDLSSPVPSLVMSKVVSATLDNIGWNSATDQFLLQFLEDEAIVIQALDGSTVASTSKNIRDHIFGTPGPWLRDYGGDGMLFAVSPSGKRIVFILDKIYVLSCR